MIGPGKGLDTDKYFVISSNVIGGCSGSTGPASENPATGRPYGTDFPIITIADMVNAQAMLLDHLGIEKLLAAVGGSMGGMQVLEWAVSHPERVHLCVPLATAARQPTQAIAFNEVGRQAIMADPDWRGGHYYGGKPPAKGLSVARMVGHITYLSDEAMQEKFGRRLRDIHEYSFTFSADFEVESYLRHQGLSFTNRFDANTYLYITRALDYFDLTRRHGTLVQAFRDVTARFLVLALQQRLAAPAVPAQGDRERPARHPQARELLRGREPLRPRRLPSGTREDGGHHRRVPGERRAHLRAARLTRTRQEDSHVRRIDYKLIEDLVPHGSTVLDLACGDGELLSQLIRDKGVRGSGVDVSQEAVEACVRKGLSVFHGDLDAGLADFADGSHDVVILSMSLQQLRRPRMIVREMVRVGRQAIVSFPNFAHWTPRLQLLLGGRMPVSRDLPLPVVGHTQHPPLHHQGLPRALPRGGPVHRAGAVPRRGGQAAAAARRAPQPDGAPRDLRGDALLDGGSLSAPARSGYTTGTLCASETGVSGTRSAPRHHRAPAGRTSRQEGETSASG